MRSILTWICLFTLVMFNLCAEQKVVVISGATSGIGISTAMAFQAKGWKVWAGYRSQIPTDLQNLENIRFCKLDVTNDAMVAEAIQTILQEDGRIDALINNAGYGLIASEETASIAEIQKLFDVNFYGALRLIQAVLPTMREQKSGHIINISSTSGVRALPALGIYAATKFALEAISESLAVTVSPWNIQVALVQPGRVNNAWVKHADFGTRACDVPIYTKLEQSLVANIMSTCAQGQSCEEIGRLIVEVAENPKPDMRYQTSSKVKETVAKKFVDLTGNGLRDEQLLFFRKLLEN